MTDTTVAMVAAGVREMRHDPSKLAGGGEFVSSQFGVDDVPTWPGHDFGLTLREIEVAALLADGLSNKEIAIALWISENTVKTHLKAMF